MAKKKQKLLLPTSPLTRESVCDICGHGGALNDLAFTLSELGVFKEGYAHIHCVIELVRFRKEKEEELAKRPKLRNWKGGKPPAVGVEE